MPIDRYIAENRVIDLQSRSFESALSELLEVCDIVKNGTISKKELLATLVEREEQMTTYLGNGVCLPHCRVKMRRRYVVAVGRCPKGLAYEGQPEYEEVRYIFLLLAAENVKDYLNSLSSLASVFQNARYMDRLAAASKLSDFYKELKSVFDGSKVKPKRRLNRFNKLILSAATKIAKGTECTSILVFADTLDGPVEFGKTRFKSFKTVLVVHGTSGVGAKLGEVDSVISIRSYGNHRFSQLRSAVLIGLTRGVFSVNDRLCSIGGLPQSHQFDSIRVIDVRHEFNTIFASQSDLLPSGVKPEVVERILMIATELAVEGREGHAVGALFALGDSAIISEYTKPLILNPFFGYEDEDRNILSPFMDETVKELSLIDGAFVIRGDGVLISAGSLIHVPDYSHELPSGLGSRHAAAASITKVVDCLCIVVSESTARVTLFRHGKMLPLIEKALERGI